jgi:hypothetical protein
MWLLLYLWGCLSDHFLTYEKSDTQIEYVYVQDNYIPGEVDSGIAEPIWVDSFSQPKLSNGVDIIWVIDGSGSMQDDYDKILIGIDDMMNNLPNVSWRLMIISMSPFHSSILNSFPLLPGDTTLDALIMFSDNVIGTHEKGFESVYSYIIDNPDSQNWMRDDASLLVVFVSDEEEQSNTMFPLVDMYSMWLDSYREHVYVSSIINVNVEDSLCNYFGHNVGERYMDLTNLYAGQIVDICSEDWSQGVADAANQLQLTEWYDLTMTPTVQASITVFVDGILWQDWEYNVQENRVYFLTVPPEESLVEIAYYY